MSGPNFLDPNEVSERVRTFYKLWDRRVIGQPRGKYALGRALENLYSPYRDKERPIFVSMLLGPSGAGKTLSAEVLAEFLFGNPKGYLKIPGETYNTDYQLSQVLGSAPGLVGFDEDADPRRPFPLFSWWNVYRYDYEHRYGEKLKGQEGAYKETAEDKMRELNSRIVLAEMFESRLERRFEVLAKMREFCNGDIEWIEREIERLQKEGLEKDELRAKTLKQRKKIESVYKKRYDRADVLAQDTLEQLLSLYMSERNLQGEFAKTLLEAQNEAIKNALSTDIPDFEEVKEELFGIILIDEVEKAHPKIHEALFGVMDKGWVRLTDGQEIDLSNTIIVMTSNVGAGEIAHTMNPRGVISLGSVERKTGKELEEEIYKSAEREYQKFFSAPFRGRIDEVEVYRPLGEEEVKKIVAQQVLVFRKSVLPVDVRVLPEAIAFLAQESYDRPELGARFVGKKLNKYLRVPFGRFMNRGDIKPFDILLVGVQETAKQKKGKELCFEHIPSVRVLNEEEKKIWISMREKQLEEDLDTLIENS